MPISRLDHRKRLRSKEHYIIDRILPAGTLNLIGGSSGMGKTTWLLQMLKDWSEGRNVLGYQSHPCEWMYVSADRGTLETDRTMRRLGLGDWDAPIHSIEEVAIELDIFKLYAAFPKVDLFVIEGLQGFLPDTKAGQSQNKAEMHWVAQIRRKILAHGKTIIAVTHNPKQKMGEEYSSGRSNFLGTQSLLGSCSTLISFNYTKDVRESKKFVESDEREVVIRGRDFPDILVRYTKDRNGVFLRADSPESEENMTMDIFLASHDPANPISSMLINNWAQRSHMSKATLYRWIEDKIAEKSLERVGRGAYTKLTGPKSCPDLPDPTPDPPQEEEI